MYDAVDAETIEDGIDAAREHGDVDTYGEAVAELAWAYTGWEVPDDEQHATGAVYNRHPVVYITSADSGGNGVVYRVVVICSRCRWWGRESRVERRRRAVVS